MRASSILKITSSRLGGSLEQVCEAGPDNARRGVVAIPAAEQQVLLVRADPGVGARGELDPGGGQDVPDRRAGADAEGDPDRAALLAQRGHLLGEVPATGAVPGVHGDPQPGHLLLRDQPGDRRIAGSAG